MGIGVCCNYPGARSDLSVIAENLILIFFSLLFSLFLCNKPKLFYCRESHPLLFSSFLLFLELSYSYFSLILCLIRLFLG